MSARSRTVGGVREGAERWRFAAALALLGVVATGCAGAMGPGLPEVAPAAPREAYRGEVAALAREARALVMDAAAEQGASGGTEAEGCGRDAGYGGALYTDAEPLASSILLVSAEDDCNQEDIACNRRCLNNPNPPYPSQKKGDWSHREYCRKKCHAEYMECMRKAGLVKEFSALSAAADWVKAHGVEVVGTIVIVGVVVYVVVATGGAAAALAPAL